MQTIHPLIIGINNYPIPHHRLNGCVRDANLVYDFFKEYSQSGEIDFREEMKPITDEAATRQGIIDAFDTAFKDIKDGDICLLYFSGHGSRMNSPKEFWNTDLDHKMESLVCHDSRLPGGRDLSDKELSYLIWKYTQGKDIHFLAIFDCCHAGSMTRDVEVTLKMAEDQHSPTSLEQLEGYKEYKKLGDFRSPPVGKHISLSSCRSYEVSIEMTIEGERRGVFTWVLLDSLKNNNIQNISYEELIWKTSAKVKNKYANQHPLYQTYIGFNPKERFMGGAISAKSNSFIYYDKDNFSWILNQGEIHGIKNNAIVLCNTNDGIRKSVVTETNIGHSLLIQKEWMNQTEQYNCHYIENPTSPLLINISNIKDAEISSQVQNVITQHFPQLKIVENQQQYDIHLIKYSDDTERLVLLRPGSNRPIFKTESIHLFNNDIPYSIHRFLGFVDKVRHWEHVNEWHNPNAFLRLQDDVEIRFEEVTQHRQYKEVLETKVIDNSQVYDFSYSYDAQKKKWFQPLYALSIRNTGKRSLWIGTLFLNESYGISNNMPLKEIAPGSKAYISQWNYKGYDYSIIPLKFPKEIQSWGEQEIRNQIKIFISTEQFQLENFVQDDLRLEIFMDANDSKQGLVAKGEGWDDETIDSQIERDWTVVDLNFNIIKPSNGIPLNENETLKLNDNMVIEGLGGFTADYVRISSPSQTTKSLLDISPNFILGSQYFKPFDLSGNLSKGIQDANNVLELHDIHGAEKVNKDNPLKIRLNDAPHNHIIPFSYEDGLLLPVGYMKNGKIHIEQLPAPSEVITKGLGKSVKIYFSEFYHTKLKKEKAKYPILAQVAFNEKQELKPIENYEKIKENIQQESCEKILIIIHGIIGDCSDKSYLAIKETIDEEGNMRSLKSKFDIFLSFDYESLGTSIEDNAELFKKRLEQVGLTEGHGKEVHIIAHSMGGLVSRYFLEVLGGDTLINHLVIVGTPNLGSPIANVYDLTTMALGKAINFLPVPAFVNSILGYIGKAYDNLEVTVNQLQKGSEITKLLEKTKPRIPYTIISGDVQKMQSYTQQEAKLFKKVFRRYKLAIQEKFNRLLFNDNSDAVVAIESQQGVPESGLITILESIGSDQFSYFNTEEGLKMIHKIFLEND